MQGDCREVMATLPEASVDAVVCDPPYELGFMGRSWDKTGVANDPETWRAALRVLKPGGHLLAFSGTRTYHRMVCAIEDAGFEIRDQIGWVYGSGFPKSLDVSKAIDKAAGAEREVVGSYVMPADSTAAGYDPGNRASGWKNVPNEGDGPSRPITAPATDAARQWQGWGTALKPAWEPICMARKPLVGTVAANVLKHGTGALNIDACRVGVDDDEPNRRNTPSAANADRSMFGVTGHAGTLQQGRWPANIIHDGSDEVLAAFPQTEGISSGGGMKRSGVGNSVFGKQQGHPQIANVGFGDSGSAARFFKECEWDSDRGAPGSASRLHYTAKASAHDRNDGTYDLPQVERAATWGDLGAVEGNPRKSNTGHVQRQGNHHPTVKPTDLMRYLCRLVTPPGGVVLDPFMGSGSTLKAAELEGFDAIGIELDEGYIEIARRRIASDAPLFAEVA